MQEHNRFPKECESCSVEAASMEEINADQAVEAGKKPKKLTKKQEILQALKFTGFSISAGVIQLGLTTLLNEAIGLVYWASYLIGIVASVLWNFTLNRKFTFKSANNVPIAMSLVACYNAVFIPASTWWAKELEGIGWPGVVVTICTMLINFITEFIFDRFVVFRKSINTQVKTKPLRARRSQQLQDGADAPLQEETLPMPKPDMPQDLLGAPSVQPALVTNPVEQVPPQNTNNS